MSLFRRGDVWWYEFWFAGRRIRESSKSTSKTVAQKAEQKRLRELEEGFNNVVKTIKKNAYGFHDWQYFRLKILRKCGKLGKASTDRD